MIQPIWLVITHILLVALSFFFCHFKTEHSIYSSLFNSRLYSREISALPSGLLIISVTSPALWRLSLQLQLYLTSLTCLSLSLSPPLFFPSPTDLLHLFSNYIPLLGQYWRLDHLAFWPLVLSVCLSPLVESVDESMWLRLGWFRRWRNRRIRWMREREKKKRGRITRLWTMNTFLWNVMCEFQGLSNLMSSSFFL